MSLNSKLPLVLTACLAFLWGSAAIADTVVWNQAEVTQLAKQLADAGNAWQTALSEQTGGDQMDNRMMDLQNNTRIIRDKSVALHAQLGKGKPRDEVTGEYMSIRETVDFTKTNLQYVELQKPALDAWAKYTDALAKIGPYFDAKGGN